ncbi:6419_t:CDS:1, partial [Cetraspora pellucida]
YGQDIKIMKNKSEAEQHRIEHETGVKGHSILFELHSISFLEFFLVNIMHVLFKNTAQHMFRHFASKFFNNEELNNTDYKVLVDSWNEIGKILELNHKLMPMEFGRPSINIHKYYTAFKAED